MCGLGMKSCGYFGRISCKRTFMMCNLRREKININNLKWNGLNYFFGRDLFRGKLDVSMLKFPKVENKEKIVSLVKEFQKYLPSEGSFGDPGLLKHIIDGLKGFGAFGMKIPSKYGGLELSVFEYTRMREEAGLNRCVADMLYGHESLGTQGILLYGNEDQKCKYLPKLSRGEWIAALCSSEENGIDINHLCTKATTSDGKVWKLNGRKKCVINAPTADIFTVLALTDVEDHLGKVHEASSMFVVEKSFGGITVKESNENWCKPECPVYEVIFNDTPVPAENVLGEIGLGFQMAFEILHADMFTFGTIYGGVLKEIISAAVKTTESDLQQKRDEGQHALIESKIARVSSIAYAIESMSYFTSVILDQHRDADRIMESAMTKVFASENFVHSMSELEDIFGRHAFISNFPFEKVFRENRAQVFPEVSNRDSRIFIALAGLQTAGLHLQEIVTKIRNPFSYPVFVLKKLVEKRKQMKLEQKFLMEYQNYVHPNLQTQAKDLEFCVQRLSYVSETLLTEYGQEIVKHENNLCRLADIAIYIFAMTAVLARTSNYLIHGVENNNFQILLGKLFLSMALRQVKWKVEDILDGPMVNSDVIISSISSNVFKSKGYFFHSPLTDNF